MTLIHSYLFPAMWLGYLAYWWAMSTNVKVTERNESASSRLARLVLIVCAVALLSLRSVPLPMLNERFLPLERLVLLEWRGSYRRGSTLFCLGTSSPREKLEPSRHREGRSRTHYKWPLRAGSPPHLCRASAGISWFRSGPW